MLTKIEIHEDYWKKGTRFETTRKWTLWRLAFSLYWRIFLVHAILILLLVSILGGSCGMQYKTNPKMLRGLNDRVAHSHQQQAHWVPPGESYAEEPAYRQ